MNIRKDFLVSLHKLRCILSFPEVLVGDIPQVKGVAIFLVQLHDDEATE
jgi:hypothetical protein